MRSSQRPGPVDPAAFSRALDEAATHAAAGRLEAAAQVYRRLEKQAPGDVRAAYSLAVIDIRQGRLERARRRLEAVTAREPGLVAAQHNLGAVRQSLGDWPGAAEAYERALHLRPEAAETRAALAVVLAALGRGGEAIGHHRVLAGDAARRWAALSRIALIDPAAIDDDELVAMQAAATDAGADARDPHRPLLRARRGAGSARARRRGLRSLRRRQPAEAREPAHGRGRPGQRRRGPLRPRSGRPGLRGGPCGAGAAPRRRRSSSSGMPRSGSTLIEQILASHPKVQGLGETGVLPGLLAHGYPQTASGLKDLADRYLAQMRARGWDGRARFVDKTLENYLHVGLIGLLFPKAAILHAVREPMDVCFACYRQLFAGGNETLYDLADIAAEYRRYREPDGPLDRVLPGRVRAVAYEALVADPEGEAQRLIGGGLDLGPGGPAVP